ncbi:thioesterase domain-containing protein [Phaeobacter gallaeciensis]|uniref:Thioesterase domain-containing protein n=1 Tax=Phaeobacter gallaeciensis TaxID=60890 RepID=A0AAC9ZBH6_9RHOB|nr:putative domain protein 1 [Phaeobacter gallaeciensis DSM 26640]ATE94078.1 thioesterase domain-containing protein [Phaeobacter gallaeciensis]ATE96101.1 thioesterase domain-containing protein [Phaeobacter gallaeciensis]ATF02742.1 thioesterase domain-containing protein [Phaeobacter gallaeciensis]ATF07122.1 thioesterase domain-containing protein [Phaeobacter gallaeciensis]
MPVKRIIEDPGCQQLVGYRTEIDTRTGACRVSLELAPQHLNRNGLLHGGIVATLMDVVCGNTASQHFDVLAHPPVVTVSLTLSYVAAARTGRVEATAKATGGGASLAYVTGELVDSGGHVLATASGVFKRIRR